MEDAEDPRARGLGQDLVEVIVIRQATDQGAFVLRGRLFWVLLRLRLAGVGNHALELGHGQNAGDAEFSDDEGRRAAEFKRLGLIAVALDDGVDLFRLGREIGVQTFHVDGTGQQLANARLGQPSS